MNSVISFPVAFDESNKPAKRENKHNEMTGFADGLKLKTYIYKEKVQPLFLCCGGSMSSLNC